MAVRESQLRAKRKYDDTHPLKTSLDSAIRGARRLGVTGLALEQGKKNGKLAKAIEKYPDRYQEAILDLATLYTEAAKQISGSKKQ